MKDLRTACFALACAAASLPAVADVSSFDAATGVLTVPTVGVGAAVYGDVRLLHRGNFVFDIVGGAELPLGAPLVGNFDFASGVLTIPAVRIGGTTFLDVRLLHTGNLAFLLQSARELPASLTNEVSALMRSHEQLYATQVPANGTTRMALTDACWLDNGEDRAYRIADTDADLAAFHAREAYQIGRTVTNVQVLAVRETTNADGSARREVDVQFDVVYRDGTANAGVQTTLIGGSSAGSCSTPQTATTLRFFGNRQFVHVAVQPRNTRDERRSITTGAALSPAVNHRRSVRLLVTDPLGHARYAIVSGPGPAGSVGGTAVPFSLKLISPRLLRSAPELAGKPGNYLNWLDDDIWRYCRIAGSGVPVAAIADCAGEGATGVEWGVTTGSPGATADDNFAAQGWVAGGLYRFDLYDDDGWKTVNGHAGRTPIATYWATLPALPYTFVQMTSGSSGLLPRLAFGSMSYAQVATNAASATPAAMSVSWNALPALPDGRRFGLYQGYHFHQGPKVGNTGGAAYPAYRTTTFNHPGSTATAQPSWPVTPRHTDQASKSYFENTLLFVDRNDSQLLSIVSFQ